MSNSNGAEQRRRLSRALRWSAAGQIERYIVVIARFVRVSVRIDACGRRVSRGTAAALPRLPLQVQVNNPMGCCICEWVKR